MKQVISALAIASLLSSAAVVVAAEDAATTNDPNMKYKKVIKDFATTLKGELKAAIKAGGPIKGIEVCHTRATEIGNEHNKKTGFEIRRVSFKNRNPLNAPREVEKPMLEAWAQQSLASAEDAKKLQSLQKVTMNGQEYNLFMMGIGVGEVCLNCHGVPGETMQQAVADKIKTYYPDDKATGYKLNELRGAFAIYEPLTVE